MRKLIAMSAARWLPLMVGLFFSLVFPVLVLADDQSNPFRQMKSKLKFNWGILTGADWLFWILAIVFSILNVIILVLCIWKIGVHILKIVRGQDTIKNKMLWIEVGVVVLYLVLMITGAFFDVLAQIYDWANNQQIGTATGASGNGTTTTKTGG